MAIIVRQQRNGGLWVWAGWFVVAAVLLPELIVLLMWGHPPGLKLKIGNRDYDAWTGWNAYPCEAWPQGFSASVGEYFGSHRLRVGSFFYEIYWTRKGPTAFP